MQSGAQGIDRLHNVGGYAVLGLLSAVLGALVGLGLWALLSLAYWLIAVVWEALRGLTGNWFFFPVVACTLGGVALGLWNGRYQSAPQPFSQVIADVRATGSYPTDRIVSRSVSFLLPIVFGGSVGPGAGLAGILASGCTWVGGHLKRVSVRLGVLASPADVFPRAGKVVVYSLGVVGGVAGAALFSALLGGGMAIPRFDAIAWDFTSLVWALPLACAGYILALLYGVISCAVRRLSKKFDEHPALRPIICGIALGMVTLFLPNVPFPGSQQAVELIGSWVSLPSAVLLLTGLVKLVFVALCLNMGWNGGPFFPIMFCGISFAYGVAGLTGLDPSLCIVMISTVLVTNFSHTAVAALILVVLCFPLASLPWALVAIVVGILLPIPGEKRGSRQEGGRAWRRQ